MMGHGQWIRVAIGVIVGMKLLGLIPFLRGPFGASYEQETAGQTPTAALAAERDSHAGNVSGTVDGTGDDQAPQVIPGDAPSATFSAESAAVRKFHQAMLRRSEDLTTREAELARREKAIAAAAKDLEKKIAHLESLGAGGNETGSPAMEQLGKIYGAMKAEEAAPLLDRLDNETVRAIFGQMKQRQISAILPLMKPEKAVALTKLLGKRRGGRDSTDAGGT